MLRPNKAVERPPEQYRSGPTATGKTIEVMLPFKAVNRLCQTFNGIRAGSDYVNGCYLPELDQIYLPSDWPSKRELNALREHEWAHARGWRHEDHNALTASKGRSNALKEPR